MKQPQAGQRGPSKACRDCCKGQCPKRRLQAGTSNSQSQSANSAELHPISTCKLSQPWPAACQISPGKEPQMHHSPGHCQLQAGCRKCRQSHPCSSATADKTRLSVRWPFPWLSGAESSAHQQAISGPASLLRAFLQHRWECGKAARSAA